MAPLWRSYWGYLHNEELIPFSLSATRPLEAHVYHGVLLAVAKRRRSLGMGFPAGAGGCAPWCRCRDSGRAHGPAVALLGAAHARAPRCLTWLCSGRCPPGARNPGQASLAGGAQGQPPSPPCPPRSPLPWAMSANTSWSRARGPASALSHCPPTRGFACNLFGEGARRCWWRAGGDGWQLLLNMQKELIDCLSDNES